MMELDKIHGIKYSVYLLDLAQNDSFRNEKLCLGLPNNYPTLGSCSNIDNTLF